MNKKQGKNVIRISLINLTEREMTINKEKDSKESQPSEHERENFCNKTTTHTEKDKSNRTEVSSKNCEKKAQPTGVLKDPKESQPEQDDKFVHQNPIVDLLKHQENNITQLLKELMTTRFQLEKNQNEERLQMIQQEEDIKEKYIRMLETTAQEKKLEIEKLRKKKEELENKYKSLESMKMRPPRLNRRKTLASSFEMSFVSPKLPSPGKTPIKFKNSPRINI